MLDIIDDLRKGFHLDLSKYGTSYLNKILQKRMKEANCTTSAQYLEYMESHPEEASILDEVLQNNYSLFFRNQLTFSVLDKIVLPNLLHQASASETKEIRIWSMACASGEEPYSLAILLEEHLNGHSTKRSSVVFASDQSEAHLNEAKKGLFEITSMGNVCVKQVNKYFEIQENKFAIRPALKSWIQFSIFDIFNDKWSSPPDSIFGDFDIVICANLLFYYQPEYQNIILNKAKNRLAKGGLLICGETERGILIKHGFEEAFPQSCIFKT